MVNRPPSQGHLSRQSNHSNKSKSIQSRNTQKLATGQTGQSVSPSRQPKGTLSHENLRSTLTDRILEPRCDNEDLKDIDLRQDEHLSRQA